MISLLGVFFSFMAVFLAKKVTTERERKRKDDVEVPKKVIEITL